MSGWAEVDGRKAHLWVQNYPDFWDSAVYYVQGYGDPNNSNCQPSTSVPDDIAKEPFQPDFSVSEAIQMGDTLIAELGFENVVCDQITPVYFADAMLLRGAVSVEDAESYYASRWDDLDRFILDTGFQLQYVRTLNGFPLGYTSVEGINVEEGNYASVWPYETIEVCVTRDGVVYFKWRAPTEAPVLELEDTQLMSFDEIASVFERMIMVKYSYIQTINDNGGDARPRIQIDKVRLSLMRIKAKNSRDTGLLIPVWDFYGTDIYQRDGMDVPLEETIVLTINAIDGSMNDRELGY